MINIRFLTGTLVVTSVYSVPLLGSNEVDVTLHNLAAENLTSELNITFILYAVIAELVLQNGKQQEQHPPTGVGA